MSKPDPSTHAYEGTLIAMCSSLLCSKEKKKTNQSSFVQKISVAKQHGYRSDCKIHSMLCLKPAYLKIQRHYQTSIMEETINLSFVFCWQRANNIHHIQRNFGLQSKFLASFLLHEQQVRYTKGREMQYGKQQEMQPTQSILSRTERDSFSYPLPLTENQEDDTKLLSGSMQHTCKTINS